MINWNTTPEDHDLLVRIADRAERAYKRQHPGANKNDLAEFYRNVLMDVTATHANGNPLQLKALLEADDANFTHDIAGIIKHINRTSGKLLRGFSPRFSVPTGENG